MSLYGVLSKRRILKSSGDLWMKPEEEVRQCICVGITSKLTRRELRAILLPSNAILYEYDKNGVNRNGHQTEGHPAERRPSRRPTYLLICRLQRPNAPGRRTVTIWCETVI